MKSSSDSSRQDSAAISAFFDEIEREKSERVAVEANGVEALKRLLKVARSDSGQCRYIAKFLLGLYHGERFPFDLTDFRCLDRALFEDCMTVLRMDCRPRMEVHCYFENGGQIWEQLAKDWRIVDMLELKRQLKQENDF